MIQVEGVKAKSTEGKAMVPKNMDQASLAMKPVTCEQFLGK